MAYLTGDGYGKSAIRLFTVARDGGRHDVRDLEVATWLEGAFERAYVSGDNSAVLPTDTMKNTVYALARRHGVAARETFAALVARRLLAACAAAARARVTIAERTWDRIPVDGRPDEQAFERGGTERRLATVTVERSGGETVEAGVDDLHVLKSGRSGFSGFPRDEYTTLKATDDRIFATAVSACWRYDAGVDAVGGVWVDVRRALVETFAMHESKSVQHTLYAMAESVLARCPLVTGIRVTMPNRHHLLADLSPFGLDNPNAVFVVTDAPYGLIEAAVSRAPRA